MKTTELLPVSCIAILLKLLTDRSRSFTLLEKGYCGNIDDVRLFMGLANSVYEFTHLDKDNNTLSIQTRRFETALNDIKSYCKHLSNNSLSSRVYVCKSWKAQLSEFLRLIPSDINLKDFHVQGGKYAPVILYGFINKLIQVKSLDIAYYKKEDTGNALFDTITFPRLVCTSEDNSICLNYDCLDVSYILNVSKFVEKYKQGKAVSSDVKYSSNQQELLRLIAQRRKAPLGSERVIHSEEIEDIYGLKGDKRQKQKNRTANVRRLNDKYFIEYGCKILGECVNEKYPIIQ